MILVESVSMKDFRGVRDLTLNFGGKNFAVCGPNGTGKSGIVDAIEFALTGNISRLSGKGTGLVSVKDHAPHVDSRNRPDKACVTLTITIPKLKKKVTIERTVKSSNKPKISPADADVLTTLEQVALHPEFVLSRRELIRYVISTPGDRAADVQALLRLDQVGSIRGNLLKIANSSEKEVGPLARDKEQKLDHLLRALALPDFATEKVLAAVNLRRDVLGLAPLAAITETTSLRDGLESAITPETLSRVPKAQARADIEKLQKSILQLSSSDFESRCETIIAALTKLSADPAIVNGVTREKFLQTALTLVDDNLCPVCDTSWEMAKLTEHIKLKIRHLAELTAKRTALEKELIPITKLLSDICEELIIIERYAAALKPRIATQLLADWGVSLEEKRRAIETFLPIPAAISALGTCRGVPEKLPLNIQMIDVVLMQIPEVSKQDAARDYLTIGQERLEAYREVSSRLAKTEERASLTRTIYQSYEDVSTNNLNEIYKQVEADFTAFYRAINRDDESTFTGKLLPSEGKLGFDVDFYGRGYFPPGAYHSEGHQDGMGLCLYLALMKHLLGDAFTLAVLDDVLMSVDAAHRREVCSLLRKEFPNTQFLLTTHDPIWLRHMKSVGLVSQSASMHFRKWSVDHGPTEWEDRDVWQEIQDYLKLSDVRSAAALLRYFLEYTSTEACDALRAQVEFHGDAQFNLGDLMPAAVFRFGELLKEARSAAQSWGRTDMAEAIAAIEKPFGEVRAASNIEYWQINPAVHYNEWAALQPNDFAPVVSAYRALAAAFSCSKCGSLFHLIPKRGEREALKCNCGAVNFNLKKKKNS